MKEMLSFISRVDKIINDHSKEIRSIADVSRLALRRSESRNN